MKLISLYIENFGCLNQFELKFCDGLTVLRESNGFGKTTLAEFIRAMFYGFPRGGKALDKNRRKKYIPWNGGKCGGHLTFEWEGAQYRIERTFGTTPKGDSFRLIDMATNKVCDRFSENIGVELFGLDGESFERSTYMPQAKDLESFSTDSIRAKLGDLVQDTNDINNFDKAVAALKNRRSDYIPYRGNGGAVAEARSRISQLQEELDDAQKKQEELTALQERATQTEGALHGVQAGLEEIRTQITQESQRTALVALRQQYEDILSQRDAVSESIQHSCFANGAPSPEEFEDAQETCRPYMALQTERLAVGLSSAEREQMEELSQFFAPGVPDEKTLEEMDEKAHKWRDLRFAADHQRIIGFEQARLDALGAVFAFGIPDEQDIDMAQEKRNQAIALRRDPMPAAPGSWGAVAVLAGFGVAFAAVALVLLLTNHSLWSVAFAMALVLNCGCVFVALKRKKEKAAYEMGKAARQQAERLEREVCDFAARYGETAETLPYIRSNKAEYLSLSERRRVQTEKYGKTMEELSACNGQLNEMLSPYFEEICDFDRCVSELRLKCRQYRELVRRQDLQTHQEAQLNCTAGGLEKKLQEFLRPYCKETGTADFQSRIALLQRDHDEFLRQKRHLQQLEEQIEKFRVEHDAVLEEPMTGNVPDISVLKRQEKEVSDEMSRTLSVLLECRQSVALLQEEVDRIPALRDDLEFWQAQKDMRQANAETLDDTLAYLEQAKEQLSGNYLGTIQRSFATYLERIMTGEKALVTSDLEVRLERQGGIRELGYFSAGQTDIVMLCMRFALVDALFAEVKPFVILDDPFVNLDDTHTEIALAMLKELAKDRQILYLVCNQSRAL